MKYEELQNVIVNNPGWRIIHVDITRHTLESGEYTFDIKIIIEFCQDGIPITVAKFRNCTEFSLRYSGPRTLFGPDSPYLDYDGAKYKLGDCHDDYFYIICTDIEIYTV